MKCFFLRRASALEQERSTWVGWNTYFASFLRLFFLDQMVPAGRKWFVNTLRELHVTMRKTAFTNAKTISQSPKGAPSNAQERVGVERRRGRDVYDAMR
jgi:hypothetical protein